MLYIQQIKRIVLPDVDSVRNQPAEARPECGVLSRIGVEWRACHRVDRLGRNIRHFYQSKRAVGLGGIGVLAPVQAGPLASDIGRLDQHTAGKLTLDSEIPVLDVRVAEIRRYVIGPW